MANEAEQAIYNRLASAPTFHPATADIFATDWGLDAGDVVAVRSGNDTYNVPVYNMSLNWKGNSRVQIQSTGNEVRKPLSALKRKQFSGGRGAYENEKELQRFHADLVQAESDLGAKIGLVVTETDEGDNVVNAASIVAGINAQDKGSESYVDIQAQYINLTGYVRATEFEATKAKIDQLTSEAGYAGRIYSRELGASTASISNLTVSALSMTAGSSSQSIVRKPINQYGALLNDTVLGTGSNPLIIPDGVATITLEGPDANNQYSLYQTTHSNSSPQLIGNFSRAGGGAAITAITKSSQTWKPALFTHGGFEVGVYASGTNVGTYSDTIEVDAAYAYSAGWTEGYDEGEADGEAKFVQATVTPQGEAETVYVADNSGTAYYQRSSTSYNRLGTHHEYKFYGALYKPEGAGPSWVSQGSGTWYLWTGDHRNAYLYQVGSSVTPCDNNSKITIKSDTRYREGTPDSTTYYTKQSS